MLDPAEAGGGCLRNRASTDWTCLTLLESSAQVIVLN